MIAFGDRAVRFPVSGSPRDRRALSEALRALPGVVDVVIAEEEGCLLFEGAPPDLGAAKPKTDDIVVATHVVPTLYDGEDLGELARLTGIDVAQTHADADYEVSFIGFMPGFAYLIGLPDALVVPRRASSRPRVPRGSVAIAAHYAGIYPSASPGGWHLLGRTANVPRWAIGDRVRFTRVDRIDAIEEPSRAPRTPLSLGDDEVTSVQGFAHVVGAPKHGRMHEGVPPGGPLVMEAFARVGTKTAIEVFGAMKVGVREIASGRDARVAYVGLRSDVPIGTRIVRGDRLAIGDIALPSPSRAEPIAIMRGPHPIDLSGTFRIQPTSDRVGTRLEGPPLPAPEPRGASTPMVKGAIEITPAGLVVLGPDHPTTGGYPVAGVLRDRSMDAFYKLPVGASVQFTTE